MKPSAFALILTAAAIAASCSLLRAQDLRQVTEPAIPPACITLKAAFTTAAATSGEIESRVNSNSILDTARIQQALDLCPKSHAVELAPDSANTAFLSGAIALRPGVTLLIDKGVTLYGSRNPADYELSEGSCGLVNDAPAGCRPLVAARNATGSSIMGNGAIDGQGGAKILLDGRPSDKSWWDLAEDARTAGRQQVPRLIETDLTDDFTLYRITLKNSPNFHVSFHRGDGLTVWGVKIDTPSTARNTDGIDPAQSRNITIAHSFIRTGDDNVAIKAGDGPTTNVSVLDNDFYSGHGMSIGSETNGGVSQVLVRGLSLDGPDNGIRIKSNATKGGLVRDVSMTTSASATPNTPSSSTPPTPSPARAFSSSRSTTASPCATCASPAAASSSSTASTTPTASASPSTESFCSTARPATRPRPSTPTSPSAPAPSTPSSPETTQPSPARKSAAPSPPAPPASSPSPPRSTPQLPVDRFKLQIVRKL